jgi:RsiW-degrading membrane proteinase PrsW (M82 family)
MHDLCRPARRLIPPERDTRRVTPFVAAGAAFLLAVLWFDLMFDLQVLGRREHPPEHRAAALASISAYYRRVTTTARPMNRLVAAVMLGTIVAICLQIAGDDAPAWVGWASLALVGSAVTLAAAHTVPSAVRLGTRSDSLDAQMRLAKSILRDHLLCVAAIVSALTIQLAFAG